MVWGAAQSDLPAARVVGLAPRCRRTAGRRPVQGQHVPWVSGAGAVRTQHQADRSRAWLYLYKCDPPGRQPGSRLASCCRVRSQPEPDPPNPPFVGDPRIDWRGDPKTESERGSKGDGRPGKRNGVRAPGRPSTSGGPQPTLRLPGGIDWEAVRNVLIAIAAIAALHPLGRLGNVLGIALGKLLLRLGISLGILGGTVAASPAGSPSIVGGPPSGLPAGTTVPPTGTTIPPVGTTIPPARLTVPPVGT